MKLTEHFKLSEFSYSGTAEKFKIDNTPPESAVKNLKNLCEKTLEPLRLHVNQPVIIGSGYRCPKVNKLVKGATKSQHMTGEAADIHIPSIKVGKEWFEYIRTHLPYDQLIWERDSPTSNHYWIHVSCKFDYSKNRHQVLHLIKNK